MSAPVIDPESSVLSYPQWLSWEHQFSATDNPYDWKIVAGAFPTGMTFQPAWTVTASDSGDVINLANHPFENGMCLVFRSLDGAGAGLTSNTRYFVINATGDAFQLAITPGGGAVAITTSYGDSLLYRPGFLTGAATVPGISLVRLLATNSTGDSAASVLFTIGIEPAAVVPDANFDLVWDFAANTIIAQTSSALNLTPAPRDTPIMFVKGGDDLILRLRTTKGASVLDLGDIEDGACKLVLKELEPDAKIIVSDASAKISSGDANSILIHAKISGDAIKAAFTNYEADGGTFFAALAEIELTYPNPGYFTGTPANLVRTSPTFRIQTERELGDL